MAAEFRFAEEPDVAAIVALVNTAYQVEKFFKIGERTDIEEVRQHLRSGRFLLLEEPAGELIGCIYTEVTGRRGYIGMLAVAPKKQRSGIGSRLIGAAEEFCREMGCHVVELTVVDLRTELPPIYERFGYRVTGTAPFPAETMPVRVPCSFVTMSKPLMGGSTPE